MRCLPFALTMGGSPRRSAKVAARVGTKVVVTTGLARMAIGLGLSSTATVHTGYPLLMVASMMVAAGMGLAMAPATESIMGSLPRAQAGVGSAVNDTTRFVGGALGVALTGSVASSVFASHLRPVLTHVPAATSPRRSSVGGAVTVGQHAPGPSATCRHRPPGVHGRFGPGDARRRRGRGARLGAAARSCRPGPRLR